MDKAEFATAFKNASKASIEYHVNWHVPDDTDKAWGTAPIRKTGWLVERERLAWVRGDHSKIRFTAIGNCKTKRAAEALIERDSDVVVEALGVDVLIKSIKWYG